MTQYFRNILSYDQGFISFSLSYRIEVDTITNDDTSLTWDFHNGTKHPDGELNRIHSDLFDPTIRPDLIKRYLAHLDSVELTIDGDAEVKDSLKTLENDANQDERFPYRESLAKILHYSAGITKTLSRGDRTIDFRAASCTGALYHIELYVICSRLPGLRAGIYHYDPESSSLQLLRKGDYRKLVFDATADNYVIDDAPVVIAYTSVFWRNAYKYQGRAFRHAFWDGGTVLAQSLAMASALDLYGQILLGYDDAKLATLLGIDQTEEFPIALLSLGYSGFSTLRDPPADELSPLVAKQGELQRQFPPIVDFIKASSLTVDQVPLFRDASPRLPATEGGDIQLRPQSTRKFETLPLEELIPKRGSTRSFSHDPLDLVKFSNLLKMGTSAIPADFYPEEGDRINEVYVVIHNVDDLQMGSYRFYPSSNRLELLKPGYHRELSRYHGLNQDLAHDAAAIVYFLADLPTVLAAYGNRGYRVAQLEAGILAGKMYLAAYAQGFGATGLTFFDDAVTEFLDQEHSTKMVSFMLCLGHKKKI